MDNKELTAEEMFKHFLENSPIFVFFKDHEIRATKLSRNYEKMFGKPLDELIGKTMDDLFPSEIAKNMIADDKQILDEGKTITVEENFNGHSYLTTKFPISINSKKPYLAGYTIDITENKESEKREKLVREILISLNRSEPIPNIIKDILLLIKDYTKIEAVSLRLKEGNDYPYYQTDGLPEHFIDSEKNLCPCDENGNPYLDDNGKPILTCMCGNVVLGRTSSCGSCFTKGGSFWSNNTTDFLKSDSKTKQSNCIHCNKEGYESILKGIKAMDS